MQIDTSDVLIVGSGMAGLTAAAYLSKAGLKVKLCEKEEKIGGLVNSFEYKGFVFDGGIRAIENSGIVLPMLSQLGIELDLLPSTVSIGIGKDVIRVTSKDSLSAYQELLEKHFPNSKEDIASIIREIGKVMAYMDVQYGIDNPLFLDLKNNPAYIFQTILPWMIKYLFTMPRVGKLNTPVYDYLSRFSHNQALLDMISQHFFTKTPASFALSYFSLYLDYRYPMGGTGALSKAMQEFILANNGEIRCKTEITRIDPGAKQAVDSRGNIYHYRKLVWAADQKTLYRVIDLGGLTNSKATRNIKERQTLISGKVGGDSVFTLYLTLDLDKSYFSKISSPHFFYTPSTTGLTNVMLDELVHDDHVNPASFTDDKLLLINWLKRYLDLTTYEISIPVLRDNSLAPEGKSGLIISSLFNYSLTKHIRTLGWYDEFKQLMTVWMISVLDTSIYPGLKAAVIDSFTSTPLTIERYTGNTEGAITGWAFTNSIIPAISKLIQVSKSVITPIPDIYQAGQWTYSPSGLPISILTGKLASDRILKDLV